jgi:hypothetical protein
MAFNILIQICMAAACRVVRVTCCKFDTMMFIELFEPEICIECWNYSVRYHPNRNDTSIGEQSSIPSERAIVCLRFLT